MMNYYGNKRSPFKMCDTYPFKCLGQYELAKLKKKNNLEDAYKEKHLSQGTGKKINWVSLNTLRILFPGATSVFFVSEYNRKW